jgi:hypothetical protein
MGSSALVPAAPPKSLRSPGGGPNTTAPLAVGSGAIIGDGGVYLTTRFVSVTLVAAVATVILPAHALLVH